MASLASPTAARLRCPTNRSRSAVRGDLIGNRLQNAPSEDPPAGRWGPSPRRSPSLCRQGRCAPRDCTAAAACTALLRSVLHELPQVIAGAPALLRQQGVEDRVRLEAGSFFDSVPAGGDAYIMKLIIHGWPDEQAVAILRNVHAAAGGDATVLLIEMVLPDHDRDFPGNWADLEMLLLGSSRERSRIPQPAGTSRIADDASGANRLALQCRRGETRVRPLTRRWLWLSLPGGQAAAVFGTQVDAPDGQTPMKMCPCPGRLVESKPLAHPFSQEVSKGSIRGQRPTPAACRPRARIPTDRRAGSRRPRR